MNVRNTDSSGTGPLTLTACRDLHWLQNFVVPWQELADVAVEPNVFYEPWALIPAMEVFASDDVDVCFVWNGSRQLVGVIPTTTSGISSPLPFPLTSTWRHPHAYLGTPLVRPGWEDAVLNKWLDYIRRTRGPAASAMLNLSDPNGPVWNAFERLCDGGESATFEVSRYARPFWRQGMPTNRKKGRSRRKNLRRLARRLKERGEVGLRAYTDPAMVTEATAEFLRLERSGWKGEQGTALDCRHADRTYFDRLMRGAANNNRLLIQSLTLDGTPIAMNIDFASSRGSTLGGFCFKTAYDATLSEFSPGLQLERRILEHHEQTGEVGWMDSCGSADADGLRAIWPGERSVGELIVSTSAWPSRTLVTALPAARRARRFALDFRTRSPSDLSLKRLLAG